MTLKIALAALVVGFAMPALAADATGGFVIIKDNDKNCRVIDKKVVSEDQLGMQVGKTNYPTREEADIDVKVICNKM
jgi:hypothetical protein